MDHIKILKRAWHITWAYPALWVFGIILAFTASGGGSSGSSGNSGSSFQNDNGGFSFPSLSPEVVNALIGVGIALLCVFFILAIAGTILRYLSETSLIRMVDGYEDTGEKVGARAGFRLGWNRASFRLFMIDLLIGLGMFAVVILGLLIAAAPLLLLLMENRVMTVIGIILAVGLFMLFIMVMIVISIAISLTINMARRAAVLDGLGVIASLRRGWEIFRKRLGDILIMGLILFGLGIAYAIVMLPVTLILVMVGILVGGLPAAAIGWIVSLFSEGALPWIVAGVIGVPLFLLIIAVPTGFIGGLVQTFVSSLWTLVYREAKALERLNGNHEVPALPEEA